MTNLEKIKSIVKNPLLNDTDFTSALLERGLTAAETYSDKQLLDLTKADLLVIISTMPNSISEGGFSVSQSDSERFLKMAKGIYAMYGEVNPATETAPKIRAVKRW